MRPLVLQIFFFLAAYLIGSVPFSLLLVRWTKGIDLRRFGSGNIGATNARRAAGTAVGVAALGCDALKGALPAAAALLTAHSLSQPSAWMAPTAATAAVLGHMFPVYLKFKPSGKGVATSLGAFLVLAPSAVGAALAVFIVVVALFRKVSLGSLAGTVALVPAAWFTTRDPALTACGALVMALIISRHKDNLKRLRQGSEPGLNDRE